MMKKVAAIALTLASLASPSAELRLSGVIGQSQPADAEPCAAVSFQGVALDAAGRLWAAPGGPRLLRFAKDGGGAWRQDAAVALPAGTVGRAAVWFNGKEVVAWLGDNRLALLDPASNAVTKTLPLPEKTSSLYVPPTAGGFAALALSGRTVFGVKSDGAAATELLTMPDLREVPYTSVGVEPSSGDILAGTPYPFQNIYRFTASGAQIGRDGWPRRGWPNQFLASRGEAWFVNQGGTMTPLPPSAAQNKNASPTLQVEFANACHGFTLGADGVRWLATSQGLLEVGADGSALTRLGGVTDVRCLAISRDGDALAMVEKGQRAIRFPLDATPPRRAAVLWQRAVARRRNVARPRGLHRPRRRRLSRPGRSGAPTLAFRPRPHLLGRFAMDPLEWRRLLRETKLARHRRPPSLGRRRRTAAAIRPEGDKLRQSGTRAPRWLHAVARRRRR